MLVGILNNIIFYFVYILLVFFNIGYLSANIIAFIVSMFNSFYWNDRYVFAKKETERRNFLASFVKTVLCYSVTGLGVNSVLLFLWIEKVGIHKMVAPIINLFVTIPINFVLNKFWAFASRKEKRSGP